MSAGSPQEVPSPPAKSEEKEHVVIRDKRRIDPVTGEPRPADTGGAGDVAQPAPESGQAPAVEAALLDERTADLQRVQAEYANYRRRAERDRLAAGELSIGRALVEFLPVIDDLDRARAHGDLAGPLKAVADKLDAALTKLGLVAFGEVGDPFDPAIHEAVLHDESADVTTPTCTTVMRRGYQHHDRLLRPAMVGVSDPSSLLAEPSEPPSSESEPTAKESTAEGESRAEGESNSSPAPPHEDVSEPSDERSPTEGK